MVDGMVYGFQKVLLKLAPLHHPPIPSPIAIPDILLRPPAQASCTHIGGMRHMALAAMHHMTLAAMHHMTLAVCIFCGMHHMTYLFAYVWQAARMHHLSLILRDRCEVDNHITIS